MPDIQLGKLWNFIFFHVNWGRRNTHFFRITIYVILAVGSFFVMKMRVVTQFSKLILVPTYVLQLWYFKWEMCPIICNSISQFPAVKGIVVTWVFVHLEAILNDFQFYFWICFVIFVNGGKESGNFHYLHFLVRNGNVFLAISCPPFFQLFGCWGVLQYVAVPDKHLGKFRKFIFFPMLTEVN